MIKTAPIVLSPVYVERFWEKTDRRGPDECWPWLGKRQRKWGYGEMRVGSQMRVASRISWVIAKGRQPSGVICHRCDNPVCVNPDHLFDGSQLENLLDCVRKGRHKGKSQTHCKHGHEFTPENTYLWKNHRHCRTCMRQRGRSARTPSITKENG